MNKLESGNIHIIFSGLSPESYNPDSGGIQLAEIAFAEASAKDGNNIKVFAGSNEDRRYRSKSGVLVQEVSMGNYQCGGILTSWPYSLSVARELILNARARDDIFHFTSLGPAMVFLSQVGEYYRKRSDSPRVVYTYHNFHYGMSDKPYDIFEKYPEEWHFLHDQELSIGRSADGVITTNSLIAEKLSTTIGRKVFYVPNTIGSLAEYALEKISSPYQIALVMCRLEKEKNLCNILQSFSNITHSHPNLRLIIAGDGGEKDNIISQMREKEILFTRVEEAPNIKNIMDSLMFSKIVITGNIRGEDKANIWRASNVFISPSLREISPLVGLESMVYGLPVLGSNIPGWEEYRELGAAVMTIDPNDIEKITDSFDSLVDQIKKPLVAKSLAEQQRKIYQKQYIPEIVVSHRLSVYKKIQEGAC